MATKVVVLGGAGYIGSHTNYALQAAGFEPVVVDNLSAGYRELCREFPLENVDILDTDRLADVFKEHRPEAVIHFAALIEVGESVKNPGAFFRNNVEGTRSVLAAMHRADVPSIVFSSTAAVYGQPGTDGPLKEDLPLAPINPYGQSKLAAEWLIRAHEAPCGIRSVALRYFNASGADSALRTGEAHKPETHLIPLVVQTALGMRKTISVYGDDYPTRDGTCIRDYIHVEDLAAAHVRACEYLMKGGATTACNLGTGNGYSVREILDAVAKVAGREIATEITGRRPGDPAFLVADNGRAKTLLGWQPQASLEDVVRSAYRWHSSETYRNLWQSR